MPFTFESTGLTPENLLALAAIDTFARHRGSGPTLRQLAEIMKLKAHSASRRHVLRLEELALVSFDRVGRSRQISTRTLKLTATGKRELARLVGQN